MRILLVVFLWVFSFDGANAVTFDVSNGGGFAGTISIDTTAGTVTAVDLTFPGMSEETVLQSQNESMNTALFTAQGPNSEHFSVDFISLQNGTLLQNGLVGYSGGTILYIINEAGIREGSGFATLSPEASATPLPAALPLFAGGLSALGLLGWRRKRKPAALAA
jgi:hypothetical protein